MYNSNSFKKWNLKGQFGTSNKYNGYYYHNRLEANIAEELDFRKQEKMILDWEFEPSVELRAYDEFICNFKPDFLVINTDGTISYIEAKGAMSQLFNFKWRLFQAQCKEQNIDFLIIK